MAVISDRGQGDAVWMLGGRYEVKASSEQTNGAMTVMEMWMPAGMGPPPHTHPGTESVYVLEGRVRYNIGGDTCDGGPGAFFHIPRGRSRTSSRPRRRACPSTTRPAGSTSSRPPGRGCHPRRRARPIWSGSRASRRGMGWIYGSQRVRRGLAQRRKTLARCPASLCIVLGKRSRRFHGRHI